MRPAHEVSSNAALADPAQIRAALDAMLAGACSPAEFGAAMIVRCREQPESLWEVLALIDQYGRRGQIGQDDLAMLKDKIGRETYGRSMAMAGGAAAFVGTAGQHAVAPAPKIVRPVSPAPEVSSAPAATDEVRPPADITQAVPAPSPVPIARLAYSRVQGTAASVAPVEPERREMRYPESGSVLLGRYVLKDKLGSGGMGTVFKALDRNRLGLPEADRYVALKILRKDLASRPEAIESMKREFLQTQQLSHPAIINVFDLGLHSGLPCITMELLHGELLSTILLRMSPRRLERGIVDSMLGEIGGALAYAHERGMLHADLKPGNIMITDRGELRVLDFGVGVLAKREPWISEPGQSFNAVTLAYASCERLAGEVPHVRDDIFSFACMAYELLAGVHPFDRKSALEAREARMAPPRIPDLSRRQWRALVRGLAWDRSRRQESLDALLRDLVVESTPTRFPAPRLLPSRPAAFGNRNGKTWMIAGALVLAILIAVAGSLSGPAPPEIEHLRQQLTRSGATAAARMQDSAATLSQWWARIRPERAPAPLPAQPQSSGAATQQDAGATDPPQDDSPLLTGVSEQLPAQVTAAPAAATGVAVPRVLPRIEFATDTVSVLESLPVARLIVHRRGALDRAATFSWRTVAGSATENLDYAAFGVVTETFAPGQADVAILVPIVRDPDPERVETFAVEIVAEGEALPGTLVATTVFIEDDDGNPVSAR